MSQKGIKNNCSDRKRAMR